MLPSNDHRPSRPGGKPTRSRSLIPLLASVAFVVSVPFASPASETTVVAAFKKDVHSILTTYCYDCHGDGSDKGNVAFDGFKSDAELVGRTDLWLAVLKNIRAGLMPPEGKPRPNADELRRLEHWIKREAFGIDPADPDPGRVTLRRLNRVEYRNTIRDLMGHDFRVEEEFPPDDTGYGFDNIGDVLSVSPLLMEKYMQAAETIVAHAVPRRPRAVQEKEIKGTSFVVEGKEREAGKDLYDFYEPAGTHLQFQVGRTENYRLELRLNVLEEFDFDPGRCRVVFKVDGQERLNREFAWDNDPTHVFTFDEHWEAGTHRLDFSVEPLVPVEKRKNSLRLRLEGVKLTGPLNPQFWVRMENYPRFFPREEPPVGAQERRAYATEVLRAFATKAFRRPADDRTVSRLVAMAEDAYGQPGRRFEDGIAHAMIPVLASPRFVFRMEDVVPVRPGETHPYVDEFTLASRLSYFLWSTMPDETLTRLAGIGELRANLGDQVKRMLADPRADALVRNFVGQWLQTRDVEGISISEREVLARERPPDPEMDRARERFEALRGLTELTPEQEQEREEIIALFRKRRGERRRIELDGDLRRTMRRETEMCFEHIVKEDRSVLELIDADYTFLNQRLADHYGIPGVTDNFMRKVSLPAGSPRGGILTQGTMLVVTSNPTRTSPVKRGLFILDNVLGTPPPPPPAPVPDLEEAEKQFGDRPATLRAALELHREDALCRSCHARMDPLGLALEHFNAMGMWRDQERGQPIDAAGELITGEKFATVREMKRILAEERRLDFYRCLTEKLLTYALGRGLEHQDIETVDRIVARLEQENGRLSALLNGILESAPFQKRRAGANPS
jgi:hypothetical protein